MRRKENGRRKRGCRTGRNRRKKQKNPPCGGSWISTPDLSRRMPRQAPAFRRLFLLLTNRTSHPAALKIRSTVSNVGFTSAEAILAMVRLSTPVSFSAARVFSRPSRWRQPAE